MSKLKCQQILKYLQILLTKTRFVYNLISKIIEIPTVFVLFNNSKK
jgi:hypothetical protein